MAARSRSRERAEVAGPGQADAAPAGSARNFDELLRVMEMQGWLLRNLLSRLVRQARQMRLQEQQIRDMQRDMETQSDISVSLQQQMIAVAGAVAADNVLYGAALSDED